jgi:hypothetical protein
MASNPELPHQRKPAAPIDPAEGNQPRLNEKTIMSRSPNQKVGIETPKSEKDVTAMSCLE